MISFWQWTVVCTLWDKWLEVHAQTQPGPHRFPKKRCCSPLHYWKNFVHTVSEVDDDEEEKIISPGKTTCWLVSYCLTNNNKNPYTCSKRSLFSLLSSSLVRQLCSLLYTGHKIYWRSKRLKSEHSCSLRSCRNEFPIFFNSIGYSYNRLSSTLSLLEIPTQLTN